MGARQLANTTQSKESEVDMMSTLSKLLKFLSLFQTEVDYSTSIDPLHERIVSPLVYLDNANS